MVAGGRQRLTVEALTHGHHALPAAQASAVRVMHVADDADASVSDLAAAVAVDPVLTAQVMRLANSAYYGLSRQVRSAEFAVSVLGFSTVRSLAASCAAGTLHEGVRLPTDFWEHAAACAVATALVGSHFDIGAAEAFSLGLLHDLGSALLCRIDPGGYAFVEAADNAHDERAALELERDHLGVDHAEAGGAVLEAWRFPASFVDAVATHHDRPPHKPSPQRRALAGGQVLADLSRLPAEGAEGAEGAAAIVCRGADALACGDVRPDAAFDLSRIVRDEAAAVAATFRMASSVPVAS